MAFIDDIRELAEKARKYKEEEVLGTEASDQNLSH